jgi:hypothetical protein
MARIQGKEDFRPFASAVLVPRQEAGRGVLAHEGVITMRSLRGLTVLAVAVGLAAGCGSTAPPGASSTPGSHPTTPPATAPSGQASAPAPPAPATPAPAWSTTTRTAAPSHAGNLTAVSVGGHASYDRVVFTFSGGIPGYTIGYVNEVLSDAKGDTVTLPGQAFLHTVFHPASGYRTYSGPSSITPVFPSLLQVRAAGDFESYLGFGAGLSQRVGFRVFTLTQPYRVVIDVAHASLPPFPGVWDITTWPQFWGMQAAFNEGHQPWRGNPLMVVQAWAYRNMTNATVRQTGPDTFKVTEPGTGRQAVITGTRPVTVGMAELWVITKISS